MLSKGKGNGKMLSKGKGNGKMPTTTQVKT
jgi:hypothetical protein